MSKSPFKKIIFYIFMFFMVVSLFRCWSYFNSDEDEKVIHKNSILKLDLSGVILNGKKFIKHLDRYAKDPKIKAIIIDINSPGGAVGPSQEIFSEVKRIREEQKIPVVCYSNGMIASGAYYVAVACDKIVVAPGALVGSIGVILQFANLEKLYDWAKISRYSITSGKFKDSGAEYRAMREDERALFQGMVDEVYQQFRSTVKDARALSEEVMSANADGRVFSGATAVKLGFADQEGTFQQTKDLTAKLAGLDSKYEMFEIPKNKKGIFDWAEGKDEDPINSDSVDGRSSLSSLISQVPQGEGLFSKKEIYKILNLQYMNQPMLLMPGFW